MTAKPENIARRLARTALEKRAQGADRFVSHLGEALRSSPPELRGAVLGALLGGGGGAVSGLLAGDSPWSNAVFGALLGTAAGGAAGLGYNVLRGNPPVTRISPAARKGFEEYYASDNAVRRAWDWLVSSGVLPLGAAGAAGGGAAGYGLHRYRRGAQAIYGKPSVEGGKGKGVIGGPAVQAAAAREKAYAELSKALGEWRARHMAGPGFSELLESAKRGTPQQREAARKALRGLSSSLHHAIRQPLGVYSREAARAELISALEKAGPWRRALALAGLPKSGIPELVEAGLNKRLQELAVSSRVPLLRFLTPQALAGGLETLGTTAEQRARLRALQLAGKGGLSSKGWLFTVLGPAALAPLYALLSERGW